MMKIQALLKTLAITTLVGFTSQLFAADLWQVYLQAVKSDPILKEALAARNAALEQVPQSRAVLLPQIEFTELGTIRKYRTTGDPINPDLPAGADQTQKMRTLGFSLSLKQTIFNLADWQMLAAAKYSVKSAVATYNTAAQELMRHTAQTYFNVLQAEDILRATTAEKEAFYQEYLRAKESFKVGVKTITDVYNAKASYDEAIAQHVRDKNELADRREDLRALTGVYYRHLTPLKKKIPLIVPYPNNIEQWVSTGVQQNWSLKSAHFSTLAAHKNVKAASAGHVPTVDLSAKYINNYTHYNDVGNYRTKGPFGAIEFNLPIFSGGNVTSQTREKIADYEYASSKQEEVYRDVMNQTRQSFLGVESGISSVEAMKQAIISNASSLEGMQAGYKVGTRTMVDVLNAQKALYNSQKNYAVSRYAYIMSGVSLKEAAGTLNENDLRAINVWLKSRYYANHYRSSKVQYKAQYKRRTQPKRASHYAIYMQVAAYSRKADAEKMMQHVYQITHQPTRIYTKKRHHQTFYCVQIGPMRNHQAISRVNAELQSAGYGKPWIIPA